ncbi:MAG: HepT-like ribonuclease domain-containing protein [Candidatus Bathyarchaeia archaeon]
MNVVDHVALSALRWEVYRCLQDILDAMAMIVADMGLRKPSTYVGLAETMLDGMVIDVSKAEIAKRIVVARNILAHAYRKLSKKDLESVVKDVLPSAKILVETLLSYVESNRLDPPSSITDPASTVFKEHRVKLAYFFGSRSRGVFRLDSDYDYAVLFGRDANMLDEIDLTMDLAEMLRVPVDSVNVVALDFADLSIIYRVLKEGRLLYCEDEGFKRNWERRTLLEILDSGDLRDLLRSR